MGLIEERAVHAFRDFAFPRWKSAVQRLVGHDVPVEVEWAGLADLGTAPFFTQNATNVYFVPLVSALEQTAIDDIGREALRNRLQRIVIGNFTNNIDAGKWAQLSDGVLTLDHSAGSNVDSVNERVQVLLHLFESTL